MNKEAFCADIKYTFFINLFSAHFYYITFFTYACKHLQKRIFIAFHLQSLELYAANCRHPKFIPFPQKSSADIDPLIVRKRIVCFDVFYDFQIGCIKR